MVPPAAAAGHEAVAEVDQGPQGHMGQQDGLLQPDAVCCVGLLLQQGALPDVVPQAQAGAVEEDRVGSISTPEGDPRTKVTVDGVTGPSAPRVTPAESTVRAPEMRQPGWMTTPSPLTRSGSTSGPMSTLHGARTSTPWRSGQRRAREDHDPRSRLYARTGTRVRTMQSVRGQAERQDRSSVSSGTASS